MRRSLTEIEPAVRDKTLALVGTTRRKDPSLRSG
jgi:hypothetical protein